MTAAAAMDSDEDERKPAASVCDCAAVCAVAADIHTDSQKPPAAAAAATAANNNSGDDDEEAKPAAKPTVTSPPRLGRIEHEGLLLLSAYVPVFSKSILGCLDRPSLLKVFEVGELKEHFQLEEYYCVEHATALAVLEGYDTESDEDEEDEDSGDEGGTNSHEKTKDGSMDKALAAAIAAVEEELHDISKLKIDEEDDVKDDDSVESKESDLFPRLRCMDCEEAALGRERCPRCDEFEHETEVYMCEHCNMLACENCRDDMPASGYCEGCGIFSCGEGDCAPVFWCEGCDTANCFECRPICFCDSCGEDHGCVECSGEEGFFCHDCNLFFCYECKGHVLCEGCDGVYCSDCRGSFECRTCNTDYCSLCKRDEKRKCEGCRGAGCSFCSFKCTECETVTCFPCTKQYKCTECNKRICADCQDVFQTCCCDKKGKFKIVLPQA